MRQRNATGHAVQVPALGVDVAADAEVEHDVLLVGFVDLDQPDDDGTGEIPADDTADTGDEPKPKTRRRTAPHDEPSPTAGTTTDEPTDPASQE